jgi:hypothetical protein
LETDDHIDDLYSILRRQPKVGNGRGEIGGIGAQWLVSASRLRLHLRLLGLGGRCLGRLRTWNRSSCCAHGRKEKHCESYQ